MDYNRKYVRSQSDSNSILAREYLTKKSTSVSTEHDHRLFHTF